MNWTQTINLYLAECRSVSGGKGEQKTADKTVASTEKSQSDFTKQLQQSFQTNNAAQQNQLNFLTQKMQDGVNNPHGFSPAALTAMRTQAIQGAATENKDVMGAINNKFATQTGAGSLPSGVQEQILAGTEASVANQESNAQLGITQADSQLQNENRWKAVMGATQVAGLENPSAFAQDASGAASTVSGLSESQTYAQIQAQAYQKAHPGLGSVLGGIAGAGLSLIPGVGPILSKVAGPALGALGGMADGG